VRDHLQCKWHVRPDEFGYTDLADPNFSNAQTFSFLQRARDAQQQFAPDGLGARFKLVTNWRLRRGDPLSRLILMQWQAFDLARLFDGTTDASLMGSVRKLWRDHLGIDDGALHLVARTLGVTLRLDSGEEFRDRLNDRFAAVGLIRVPSSEASFFYDDLIGKLHGQGRKDFDRDSFRAMCEQEKLLDNNHERNPITVGVRRETGSHYTASSANQYGLHLPTPIQRERGRICGRLCVYFPGSVLPIPKSETQYGPKSPITF